MEDIEHLAHGYGLFKFERVLHAWDTEEHTVVVRLQVEDGNISAGGHENRCVVVNIVAHSEVATIGVSERFEDSALAVCAGAKHLDDLFSLLLLLKDFAVFAYDLMHALFDGANHVGRERLLVVFLPLEGAVVAFADRVLDTDVCLGVKLMDGASENHVQGAGVAADTARRAGIKEFHVFWLVEEEIKVLCLVVDMRRYDGVRQTDAYALFELDERDATGDIVKLLGVFAKDGNRGRHRLLNYLENLLAKLLLFFEIYKYFSKNRFIHV